VCRGRVEWSVSGRWKGVRGSEGRERRAEEGRERGSVSTGEITVRDWHRV